MTKGVEMVMRMATMAALMLCCVSAFAGPTFESVTFGKQSTHCDAKSARATVVPDGGGISIFFDKMQIEAGGTAHKHERMRCDVTLKLTAPLDAPVTIQMDVRGMIHLTGGGAASASVTYLGHTEPVRFQWKDDDGIDRISIRLPKGAQQLGLSFEASAKGKFPDSTALIAIDSLDIVLKEK